MEFCYPSLDLQLLLDSVSQVVTLGPDSTSSTFVARIFAKEENIDEVLLFPTYELAAKNVAEHNALLVANAYSGINHFYISDLFTPLLCFFHNTPKYFLAYSSRQ